MEDENRPWELSYVEVLLGYSNRGWHLRELEGVGPQLERLDSFGFSRLFTPSF